MDAMNDLFEHCLDIAVRAHKGQKDKLGKPYILHLMRVAMTLNGVSLPCIGILHDIIEDHPDFLTTHKHYIPNSIIYRLHLLTHDKNVPYKTYIHDISKDYFATKVKIADLMDNSDPSRLDDLYKIDPKTTLRVAKKYKWALEYLSNVFEDL
jgi:(p)ppGpp synthase/HD superfamily hydrolase